MKILKITPINYVEVEVTNNSYEWTYIRHPNGNWTVRPGTVVKGYDVVDFLAKDLEELYQREVRKNEIFK